MTAALRSGFVNAFYYLPVAKKFLSTVSLNASTNINSVKQTVLNTNLQLWTQ